MARRPSGPLGNAPRDLLDDFVGEPAEKITTGPPPRWPQNPKKVKSNTFHSKVTGATSAKRADRAGHFRKGGWVRGYQGGGSTVSDIDKDYGSKARFGVDKYNRDVLGTLSAPESDIADLQRKKRYRPSDEELGRAAGSAERLKGGGRVRGYQGGGDVDPFRRKGEKQTPNYQAGGSTTSERIARRTESYNRPYTEKKWLEGRDEAIPPWQKPKPAEIDLETETKEVGPPKRKDGGRLTAKARQALPASSFALPGKGKGPKGAGAGSYPIPDKSHARNALARSSGKSEEATVRAKVKAKYPDIGQK